MQISVHKSRPISKVNRTGSFQGWLVTGNQGCIRETRHTFENLRQVTLNNNKEKKGKKKEEEEEEKKKKKRNSQDLVPFRWQVLKD